YVDAALKGVYLDRSAAYLEVEALFAQGLIDLLDHPKLIRELRNLERRPSQGGRDKVEHPRGQHDDYANALGLAAAIARGAEGSFPPLVWGVTTNHLARAGDGRPVTTAVPALSGHDVNHPEHRAECRACRASYRSETAVDPQWHTVLTPSGKQERYMDLRGLEAKPEPRAEVACLLCPRKPSPRTPMSLLETWFAQHWASRHP